MHCTTDVTSQLEFSTHSFFSSMRPISVRKKQGNIATKYGLAQTRTMGWGVG